MNNDDLDALTIFWTRETNNLNNMIDFSFKSAQDDAYARGYRRGREDLINIRKQRDDMLAALVKAANFIQPYNSASKLIDELDTVIASVKGEKK